MRKNKIVRPINSNSTLTPNIVRGGKAIDLGNNMYYIAGRKHTNGGVDVGKDLEVEGGEVMQMKPNEVRVFSSVPFLRTGSPAQLVLGGANPDVIFNAQENFKDKNRIKDDGTKYKNGGNMIATINGNVKNGLIHTMRCGGRKKANLGIEFKINPTYNDDFNNNFTKSDIIYDNSLFKKNINNTQQSNNKTRRFTDWFNNNLDKINLYSNLGGSAIDFISSAIINSKMPTVDLPTMTAPTLANLPEIKLAEIKDLEAPATVAAAKLKTRYNVNPQLSKIEDETRRTMNEIDRNTSSSRVALARKQRAAIQSQEAKNQVYGQKENIETELMNKDRLNAQQVAQANAATYNQFLTARAQQAMQKAQLKMMVDRANIGNKLAVDQFNANAKMAADRFNADNLIKEILFNTNVRTNQLGNYATGIGNLFSNIGGSFNNYMMNRNARLRDEEVLRSLRARYKEIPQEIMDYILNK